MFTGKDGTSVSGSAGKKLASCPSVLTSKSWTDWKPTLGSSKRGRGHGTNLGPQDLERQPGKYREGQLPRADSVGTSAGRKTSAVTDKPLEAPSRQVWELKSPGGPSHRGPTILWDLPPGARSGSHSKCQSKGPSCSQWWEGKRNCVEIHQTYFSWDWHIHTTIHKIDN